MPIAALVLAAALFTLLERRSPAPELDPPLAGRIAARFGPGPPILIGMTLLAVGGATRAG
ncbi:hypothetical protein [Nonomuraea fuscirosea]|uniref:hypothetical protein n=1 Tax=Nonomuraea fuscirosea TaxID=1291556 RepID=UPI003429BC85